MASITDSICSASSIPINKDIFLEFQKSPTQNIAYSTILSDILRADLYWVRESKDGNDEKLHEADDHWHHFIRDFILNLCLYGYVLIRKNKQGLHAIPTVARGTDVDLVYNTAKHRWEPHALSDALRGSKHWHLIILEPPTPAGENTHTEHIDLGYVPSSAGFRSLRMSKISRRCLDNVLLRDSFNSRPSAFTSIAKNLLSAPGSNSKPWFQAINSACVPGPQPVQDFNTLVHFPPLYTPTVLLACSSFYTYALAICLGTRPC